jgi:Protein of unknown function (DUF4232)
MDPSRVDRILDDWNTVSSQARRPSTPPRGVVVRSGLPGGMLAGAGLIVVGVAVIGALLGRPGQNGAGGGTLPTPVNSPSAIATESTPASTLAPTPQPTIGPCESTSLSARITLWEGAAGHRIADVELTNVGSVSCLVSTMARPQLVDRNGAVLIDGSNPPASGALTLAPGGVLKTLVQDGNYCGSAPPPPVSVAFVLGDGSTIVAEPPSPTDVTLPPCLGAPGSAGTIEMHPWAP